MPKLLLLLAALLAVGGSAAGAAVYLLSGDDTTDEGPPPPVVQTSPAPSPAAGTLETPTATPAPQGALPEPQPTLEPADWTTYVDPEFGLSFPHPQSLTVSEEFFDLFGKDGDSTVRMRALTFRDASGVRVLELGITPNPTGLSVQNWMDTYDPCPSAFDPNLPQPKSISIAGESAMLCPIDQLNQRNPRIYFTHGGNVFVLVGNLYGIPESGFPPALSETDFQSVIHGFSFDG